MHTMRSSNANIRLFRGCSGWGAAFALKGQCSCRPLQNPRQYKVCSSCMPSACHGGSAIRPAQAARAELPWAAALHMVRTEATWTSGVGNADSKLCQQSPLPLSSVH